MKVPIEWLKDYIDIKMTPEELAEKITLSGIEVEGITSITAALKGVVVGKVIKKEKHPDANKLWVNQIDIGEKVVQIVAGIANYNLGDLVPVALPGSILPGGLKIKKGKLRGLESEGMMCSIDELDLDLQQLDDGILILAGDYELGKELTDALKLESPILELGLTPNRADCLGLIGVARELSALTGENVRLPDLAIKEEEEEIYAKIKVTLEDSKTCSRYVTRLLKDIEIKSSPLWLQCRLLAAGIRPINNVVDISNYVMWEYGQPLHAFDYEEIKGKEIIVRRAKENEKIRTLDDEERVLNEEMLVIADSERTIALAGVMGGLDSEVEDHTKMILIESANFNPAMTRKTAQKLKLTSEASLRFEKGVDPNQADFAATRAAQLMADYCGGRIFKGLVDEYPEIIEAKSINLRAKKVSSIIGLEIPGKTIAQILTGLGFVLENIGNDFKVTVPTRRNDITEEVDLIEEIARIYGYDKIETTLPTGKLTQAQRSGKQIIEDKAKEILVASGFSESITFGFMNSEHFDMLNLPADSIYRKAIPLKNPISEEQEILRTSIIPNLLSVVNYNSNRNINNQFLYELGAVFKAKELPLENLPKEQKTLTVVATGNSYSKDWLKQEEKVDFYYLKGVLENLFSKLGCKYVTFKRGVKDFLHPFQSANICIDGETVGFIGSMHPICLGNYDIKQEVFVAEISLDTVFKLCSTKIDFEDLPKYPAVHRDIAIVIKDTIPASEVEKVIKSAGKSLVENLQLFDRYKGEQVPENHVSLAYSITYRDLEKTLKDKDVNKVHDAIEKALTEDLEAALRG